jgi:hypothetical protein
MTKRRGKVTVAFGRYEGSDGPRYVGKALGASGILFLTDPATSREEPRRAVAAWLAENRPGVEAAEVTY